jgi:hypothetical protein
VKIVGTCRVADALSESGTHNTLWRAKRQITDAAEGLDFALTYYAPFVARILMAEPFGCMRVEILPEDVPHLVLYTGAQGDSVVALHDTQERVRAMVAGEERIVGPLTCTCQHEPIDPGGLRLIPPVVVFDGWSRLAAWILHGVNGKVYPITANVILTTHDARPTK